jgi:hypothetical protein
MSAVTQRALLLAHPDTPGEAVWSIAVEAQLSDGAHLACHYALHGDMARVRIPGVGAGRRSDGLWKHTCFEAFVAAQGGRDYYEFNFSPAFDWAAYRFEDYRAGMSAATLADAPGLQVRRTARQLDLTATVHLSGLVSLRDAQVLRVALAAVVEEDGGRLSYWALQHAPGDPDFHDPDSFLFELRHT